MVVIPFSSDQPVNASSVEKLGIGKKLDYTLVNKDSLKENVLLIMNNQNIRNNLLLVKDLINNAPGNKGGANKIIEFYKNQK